jgi:hypothetical protein
MQVAAGNVWYWTCLKCDRLNNVLRTRCNGDDCSAFRARFGGEVGIVVVHPPPQNPIENAAHIVNEQQPHGGDDDVGDNFAPELDDFAPELDDINMLQPHGGDVDGRKWTFMILTILLVLITR